MVAIKTCCVYRCLSVGLGAMTTFSYHVFFKNRIGFTVFDSSLLGFGPTDTLLCCATAYSSAEICYVRDNA